MQLTGFICSSKNLKSLNYVDDFITELTGNAANMTVCVENTDHNAVAYEGAGSYCVECVVYIAALTWMRKST